MQTSDTGKLIAAFFIGLAVALGSVFFYTRLNQPQPQVAQQAPVARPEAAAPAATPKPEQRGMEQTGTEPAPAAAKPVAPKPVHKPAVHSRHLSTPATPDPQGNTATVPAPAGGSSDQPAASQPAAVAQADKPVGPPAPAYVPPPPPPPTPHVVTLPVGTGFNVRLVQGLSTEKVSTGDSFEATLTAPVIANGFVIVDKGARVKGKVVEADRSGRVKGRASLTLALSEINTTDGQRLTLQTDTFVREAPGTTGKDAAKVGGGAALGALIGAIAGGGKGAAIGAGAGGAAGTGVVLGTRGRPVELPSETALTFRLSTPLTITEQIRN